MEERKKTREERIAQRKQRRTQKLAAEQQATEIPHPIPPEDLKVEDVRFFALGHGRSGTTWLERTLGTHPEILCKGSGMFFGKNLKNFGGRRILYEVLANSDGLKSWHETGSLNLWTKPDEFEQDIAQITRVAIDSLMRRALTESGKRILGDRTPHYVSHLNEVFTLYPQAKIVHAIRDGRDVAISGMHNFWYNSKLDGSPVRLSPEETEIREAYLEDREVFLSGGRSIFTEDRIRQRARGWNRIVRRGRKVGWELFGDNYFEFFYEDHLSKPHEALRELFAFLEADISPEVIEEVIEANSFEKRSGRQRGEELSGSFLRKGIHGDWKGVFTDRDKRVFKEEAGELLIELGYEKNMDW